MAFLVLTDQEARALESALDQYLSLAKTEIQHTDERSYREALMENYTILKRLRERLQSGEFAEGYGHHPI